MAAPYFMQTIPDDTRNSVTYELWETEGISNLADCLVKSTGISLDADTDQLRKSWKWKATKLLQNITRAVERKDLYPGDKTTSWYMPAQF